MKKKIGFIAAVIICGCFIIFLWKSGNKNGINISDPSTDPVITDSEVPTSVSTSDDISAADIHIEPSTDKDASESFEDTNKPDKVEAADEESRREEIREVWKQIYPKANVICFEIDCHDGEKHIYCGTDGMPVNVWLNSKYNSEGWMKVSGNVVSGDGTKYIVYERSAASIVLHEGLVLDTADTEVENTNSETAG